MLWITLALAGSTVKGSKEGRGAVCGHLPAPVDCVSSLFNLAAPSVGGGSSVHSTALNWGSQSGPRYSAYT
jgi:hypothetical protein